MIDHGMLILYILKGPQKGLLPAGAVRKDRPGFLLQQEMEQVVNILKVVIEGLAVDRAVGHNLLDRDIVQKFPPEQLFQGRRQGLLGAGGHAVAPPFRKSCNTPHYNTAKQPIAILRSILYNAFNDMTEERLL